MSMIIFFTNKTREKERVKRFSLYHTSVFIHLITI